MVELTLLNNLKYPQCHSSHYRKDGYQKGKQRFECKDCGRLFRSAYTPKGYLPQIKKECLEVSLDGRGFRGLQRVTGIH